MPLFTETIAAPATPAGTAALALVRASGPQAAALAREIFGRPPPARQAQHGDYRDRAGRLVDDVVWLFFPGPRSFTGEDTLEITCHGNPFIAQKILEDLHDRGCRPAQPGEFSKRAFLNGRLDLSQAEAVMDLIHARSERALAAAQQQLRGALGRRLQELADGLLQLIAGVEARLDFPEEELPPEERGRAAGELAALARSLDGLLATDRYGELLRAGLRTVILGEPNAGKSSLLNRLLGRDRALVSPEPGTTRDYLEEAATVGPYCIRFVDTAGLNPAPAPLERLGMARTLEQAEGAGLILLVLDATRPCPALPAGVQARLVPGRAIVVLNKMDLRTAEAPLPATPPTLPCVAVSALHGTGLDALTDEIVRLADAMRPETGADLIAINARHAHALRTARECLDAAQQKIGGAGPSELLASDLRGALHAIGEITGKIDNERVLDKIFATFCIGK
jgi:tRNA modification GTPase